MQRVAHYHPLHMHWLHVRSQMTPEDTKVCDSMQIAKFPVCPRRAWVFVCSSKITATVPNMVCDFIHLVLFFYFDKNQSAPPCLHALIRPVFLFHVVPAACRVNTGLLVPGCEIRPLTHMSLPSYESAFEWISVMFMIKTSLTGRFWGQPMTIRLSLSLTQTHTENFPCCDIHREFITLVHRWRTLKQWHVKNVIFRNQNKKNFSEHTARRHTY